MPEIQPLDTQYYSYEKTIFGQKVRLVLDAIKIDEFFEVNEGIWLIWENEKPIYLNAKLIYILNQLMYHREDWDLVKVDSETSAPTYKFKERDKV